MYIDSIKEPNLRLKRILEALRAAHGIEVNLKASTEDLSKLLEVCDKKKNKIIMEGAFNNYHMDPGYTKMVLIMEAVRIVLSEYRPASRRQMKKRSKKG